MKNQGPAWVGTCVVCLLSAVGLVVAQAQAQERESKPTMRAEPEAPQGGQQDPVGKVTGAPVPRLVKFSGVLKDVLGKPRTGTAGITVALYEEPKGGTALWMENQVVELDTQGRYTVLLGATKSEGIDPAVFGSSAARWLGVRVQGPDEVEQPRVLLVSVPYALKTLDSETLGGRPASAFLLNPKVAQGDAAPSQPESGVLSSSGTDPVPLQSGSGTADYLTRWLTSSTLGDSQLFDDGINVGIGTSSPSQKLTVAGSVLMTNSVVSPYIGALGPYALGRWGVDSNGLYLTSDTAGKALRLFTTPTGGALTERLRISDTGFIDMGTFGSTQKIWLTVNGNIQLVGQVAHAVILQGTQSSARFGQDVNGAFFTSDTAGKALRLLTTPTSGPLAEHFRITQNGLVGIGTSAPTQKLSVAGAIESITGGFKFPDGTVQTTAAAGNFAAGTITLGGNLALPNTTSSSVGVVTLGGTPFLHNFGTSNTFVGTSAGNMTMTGTGGNTGVGTSALSANTTGNNNSAFGAQALQANTTGFNNAAFGLSALRSNTTSCCNSAFGSQALQANTTGSNNSAFGFNALAVNITGVSNSAFGSSALQSNTAGNLNAAFGFSALALNTTGLANSAFGINALVSNTTGNNNAAFGLQALFNNTTGGNNAALGFSSLLNLTSGDSNIAIGANAGNTLTTGSSNIYIGNGGVASESNTIRIGSTQTAAFMAGISGATSASGVAVFVNSSGQLGTTTSSQRFKDDIADMGGESDLLMKLRPVSFYYKPEFDDTHTRQYGLVAEEVAQVAPQLVVFGKDGAPQTVRYHFVNAMLLNEVQNQRRLVEEQQRANAEQRNTIARQQAEIQDLAARLAKLEALVAAAQVSERKQ